MEAPSPAPIAHIIVNAEEIQEKYVMNFKKEDDGIHGFVICPITNIKYLTMIIEKSEFWKESQGYFQNDFQKFYTILEGIQSSISEIKWNVVSKNEDKLSLKIFHTHTIFGFEVTINFNREHNKIDLLERKIKTLESENISMNKQLMKYEPSNNMWLTLTDGIFPSQIQYKFENGDINWTDERFVTILPGIQKYLHSNKYKKMDCRPGSDVIETEIYNEIKIILRKMCSEKGCSSFLLLTGNGYFQLSQMPIQTWHKQIGFRVIFLEDDWKNCLKSLHFPKGIPHKGPQNDPDSIFRNNLNFEYHISVPFDGVGENICEPKKIIFPEYVTNSDPKLYYDPNYNDKKYHGITDFTKMPKGWDEGDMKKSFPNQYMMGGNNIPGTFSHKRIDYSKASDDYHLYQQKYINIPHFLYCSNCIEDNGGNYVCQGH